jgi:hypothetical protein
MSWRLLAIARGFVDIRRIDPAGFESDLSEQFETAGRRGG